jgi:hypothetical protein
MLTFSHGTSLTALCKAHNFSRHIVTKWLTCKQPIPTNARPVLAAMIRDKINAMLNLLAFVESGKEYVPEVNRTPHNRMIVKKALNARHAVEEATL